MNPTGWWQVSAGSPEQRRRVLLLAALIVLILLVLLSDALFEYSSRWVGAIAEVIERHPAGGVALFLLLAIASSMVVFFSSALLVPIGVSVWGPLQCFVLLWSGWLIGGFLSYAIGWYFGETIVSRVVGSERFGTVRAQLDRHARFWHIVLLQVAVPSEIPGYVLGTLRYRFVVYAVALGITEIPYALATVYLGNSFLERRGYAVALGGVSLLIGSIWVYRRYQRDRA